MNDLYPFLMQLADQAEASPLAAVTLTVDAWEMGPGTVRVSVSVGDEGLFVLSASSDLECPSVDVGELLRGGGGHE